MLAEALADMSRDANSVVGLVAVCVGILLYLLSSTTLGRRSFTHAWLFSGLVVLSPTDDGLKKAGIVATSPSSSPAEHSPRSNGSHSNRSNDKQQRQHHNRKHVVRMLTSLEFSSKLVTPGSIPLSSLNDKNRAAISQWQALDAAVCCGAASALALLSKWYQGWHVLVVSQRPCCDDVVVCWKEWWQQRLGAGYPPTILTCFALASLFFWWRLAMHTTRLPAPSLFQYSPFSYITGWLWGLSTYWLLKNYASLTQPLGIPLQEAVEEFAARFTLLIRLVHNPTADGGDGGAFNNETIVIFQRLVQCVNILLAIIYGNLGFALADPLRETMRIYWGYVGGDVNVELELDQDVHHRSDRGTFSSQKLLRWMRRLRVRGIMTGIGALPCCLLLSYVVHPFSTYDKDPTTQNYSAPRNLRTFMAWVFVAFLSVAIPPLLQCHLNQSIATLTHALKTTKKPDADDIRFPFQSRFRNLVKTGSTLVVFPLLIVMLLTMGHLSGTPPAESARIYPFAYHNSIWTQKEISDFQLWEQVQARALAKRTLSDVSILAEFSATHANIDTCPQKITLDRLQPSEEIIQQQESDVVAVTNASQLLSTAPPVNATVLLVLGKLQKLARQQLDNVPTEADGTEELQLLKSHFYNMLLAVVFHPLVTSTFVTAILDFTAIILFSQWILYLVYFGVGTWLFRQNKTLKDRQCWLKIEDNKTCRIRMASSPSSSDSSSNSSNS